MWLLLAFLIRASILPVTEFECVSVAEFQTLSQKFYVLYEQLFGPRNCSYSVHIIASHLLQIRNMQPLTQSSAFPFEHFYGEMRRTYVSGTQSTTKQIFQNVLLKRSLAFHACSAPIHFSEKDTKLERNSLVYTFDNNRHKMFKINTVLDDVLLCHPQGYFPISFPETPEITWREVGVFKLGGIREEIVPVLKSELNGKMLVISNMLISCPINVLQEC